MPRGFYELGIIERGERLQGSVRALPPDDADLAAGGVENVHGRRWRGAFPERVEAAPVEGRAAIAVVEPRVALWHGDGFPHAIWLVWFHAGSADLVHEQTACRQRVVAHHLAVHAEPRSTADQAV